MILCYNLGLVFALKYSYCVSAPRDAIYKAREVVVEAHRHTLDLPPPDMIEDTIEQVHIIIINLYFLIQLIAVFT